MKTLATSGGLMDSEVLLVHCYFSKAYFIIRSGSRTAATSQMEPFVITANGLQPLTIITECCILDVEAVLDPPLIMEMKAGLFGLSWHRNVTDT